MKNKKNGLWIMEDNELKNCSLKILPENNGRINRQQKEEEKYWNDRKRWIDLVNTDPTVAISGSG